ncbi:HAD-like domain-containing protein [Trichoderma austrokoningii]
MAPTTIAFDLYGTILSTDSIVKELAKLFGDEKAKTVATQARRYQLEYSWRINGMGMYQTFGELTRWSFRHAAAEIGEVLSPEQEERVMNAYNGLDAYPEVEAGLGLIAKTPEVTAYVFSNGTEDMITASLRTSPSLARSSSVLPTSRVVSVDPIRVFKPDLRTYEHFAKVAGVKPQADKLWLVSSNPFDVLGARAAGWRKQAPRRDHDDSRERQRRRDRRRSRTPDDSSRRHRSRDRERRRDRDRDRSGDREKRSRRSPDEKESRRRPRHGRSGDDDSERDSRALARRQDGPPVRRSGPLPSQADSFAGTAEGDGDPEKPKEKPNMGNTGRLAALSNSVAQADGTSIVLKYHEPGEARKPPPADQWKLFVFKGGDIIDTIELSARSCWLIGREMAVVDLRAEHPSLSKQHAVIQFRYIEKRNEYGDKIGKVKPYVIDLESANGTILNDEKIPSSRYLELRDKDMLLFGHSTREYVIMLAPKD